MVISHDCDLANDDLEEEPNVEVLLGKMGDPSESGNLRWGKSPRRIHLEYTDQNGNKLLLEFRINQKRTVAKSELCRYDPQAYRLTENERDAFTRWLASRYRRSAFPDAFNDVLRLSRLGEKLESQLKKPEGEAITAVLFDLEERSSAEFRLSVLLLYSDEDLYEKVEAVAKSIRQLFEKHGHEVSAEGVRVELEDCVPISEGVLTLKDLRKLRKWEKDYISLRSNPPGKMMGEV
ncbi:hypothetical protein [Meiothermus taiwanensis]|uniref:Uncharacterized protein n=2 Tax=Meiothermus taiwanensis TaxID=172827 RepID=A0A399E305_9DEIN|nr:hypothetical protein [Meiothermus taiwanensis]AWR88001.1 hypothetical protein Mtai_v1c27760 [Meiothermus taiwanensis WR-220]KIQ54966.1 hypothetical protein SY28_05765 [Meiothermus taiwanensis]KZK14942.1 hypothetical protein A3962_12085 [Meiothermus taiwanensis]RIH77000.1 hypothetical protein Mcate_01548 [Meiothermus taiwanensis]